MKKEMSPQMLKQIKSFWRWFEKNESEIFIYSYESPKNALIMKELNRKLGYVSKRIGCIITGKNEHAVKSKIIFTADGYKKLFPKINALIDNAPKLENWIFQSLIHACTDLEKYKKGTDSPYKFPDFDLKISEMYFKLLDYNTTTKKIKIEVYSNNYKYHCDNPFMGEAITIILLDLVGEINFKKSIPYIQYEKMPKNTKSLIPLYKINQHIEFLHQINRRVKIEI